MQEEKIGRRYARALVLAIDDNAVLLKIESDFAMFSKLFSADNSDFLQLILNPAFYKEERKNVFSQISQKLSWQPVTLDLAMLLIDKDRMRYVPVIAAELSREIDERLGRVRASIVTMEDLKEQDLQKIVGALQKRIGKNVVAKTQLEHRILGGVRAQIGGLVFDHTLEAQLNNLEKSLLSSSLSN